MENKNNVPRVGAKEIVAVLIMLALILGIGLSDIIGESRPFDLSRQLVYLILIIEYTRRYINDAKTHQYITGLNADEWVITIASIGGILIIIMAIGIMMGYMLKWVLGAIL